MTGVSTGELNMQPSMSVSVASGNVARPAAAVLLPATGLMVRLINTQLSSSKLWLIEQ
jgi:hypothetical protein